MLATKGYEVSHLAIVRLIARSARSCIGCLRDCWSHWTRLLQEENKNNVAERAVGAVVAVISRNSEYSEYKATSSKVHSDIRVSFFWIVILCSFIKESCTYQRYASRISLYLNLRFKYHFGWTIPVWYSSWVVAPRVFNAPRLLIDIFQRIITEQPILP